MRFNLIIALIYFSTYAQSDWKSYYGEAKESIGMSLETNAEYKEIPSGDSNTLYYYQHFGTKQQSNVAFIFKNNRCIEIREFFPADKKAIIVSNLDSYESNSEKTVFWNRYEEIYITDIGKLFYLKYIPKKVYGH